MWGSLGTFCPEGWLFIPAVWTLQTLTFIHPSPEYPLCVRPGRSLAFGSWASHLVQPGVTSAFKVIHWLSQVFPASGSILYWSHHTWWPSPPVTGATVSNGHRHLSWEPQPIPRKQRALQAPLSVGPLGFFQPQQTLACSQDCPGAHTMPQLLEGIVSPGDSGEDICLLWFALCKKGPQVVLVSWCFIFSVGMRGGWIALLDLFPPINIINFLALRLWDGSQVGSPAVLITASLLLSWSMCSLLGPAPLVFLIPLEWDLSAINRHRQGLSPSSPVQQFQGLSKDKNVFESPLPPAVEGALLALEAGKPP